jgi:hypothetical protein
VSSQSYGLGLGLVPCSTSVRTQPIEIKHPQRACRINEAKGPSEYLEFDWFLGIGVDSLYAPSLPGEASQGNTPRVYQANFESSAKKPDITLFTIPRVLTILLILTG